nr:TonB-dependent receptor [Parvularcula maris]
MTSAYAQDADEPIQIAQQAEEIDEGDTITVTGSRIRRSEVETTNPVFTFDSQSFEDRGFANVADALNQSPLFGTPVDPNGDVGSFTAGQNQVNLFDLGVQRTLTLVNGRRLVSSASGTIGGGQVDLNTIPAALIERIETVPLTGAAIYGADAIAGTVNVILKDDFEGFDVTGQYGSNFGGEADSYRIATVAGGNFADDRGNVTLALEYNRDEGVLLCQIRELCTEDLTLDNAISNANIDTNGDGVFDLTGQSLRLGIFDQRLALFDAFGSVSPVAGTPIPGQPRPATGSFLPGAGPLFGALPDGNFYRFTEGGELAECTPGALAVRSIITEGGDPETCGADFFNAVTQIRSPVERFNAFGSLRYDLTDNIRFRQDFLYANTTGSELVEQGGFQTGFFDGTSAAIQLSADNPFLTDQARGVLDANGLDTFLIHRFNNDLVRQGENSNETHVWRVTNVIEGEFEYGGRMFYWDVSNVFGRADITQQNFAGGIVDGRFLNAVDAREITPDLLDPILGVLQDERQALIDANTADPDPDFVTPAVPTSDDALLRLIDDSGGNLAGVGFGDIICGAFVDLSAGTLEGFNTRPSGSGLVDEDLPFLDGCQPLSLIGSTASDEAIDFILGGGPRFTNSQNEQVVWQANFGGDLIDLPGGMASFNVGLESRREFSTFTPGAALTTPISRSSVSQGVRGEAITREVYGELSVPIVSADMNIPFVQELSFDGAVRYQEFDTKGPDGLGGTTDTTVYQASGRWTPVDDISFRATYATSFRNPTFVDLFLPATQTFILGADPCDSRSVGLGPNPAVRQANCESIGIDTETFTSSIQDGTISNGQVSGNPGLQPEESVAFSVGAVIQPRWIDGFQMAVDYYNVEIDEFINDVDFEILAATCFDSNNFPNEEACSTFRRDPDTNQVIFASSQPANVAVSTFESITIRAFYGFDVNDALGLVGVAPGRDWGRLNFDSFTQHNITNEFQATPESEVTEDVGDFGDPKWIGTFDTVYSMDKFRATWRMRWQNPVKIDPLDQIVYAADFEEVTIDGVAGFRADAVNKTGARFIHDLSVAYDVLDNVTLQANLLNAFDREPNRLQDAVGHIGIDEQLGRRFILRANVSF